MNAPVKYLRDYTEMVWFLGTDILCEDNKDSLDLRLLDNNVLTHLIGSSGEPGSSSPYHRTANTFRSF